MSEGSKYTAGVGRSRNGLRKFGYIRTRYITNARSCKKNSATAVPKLELGAWPGAVRLSSNVPAAARPAKAFHGMARSMVRSVHVVALFESLVEQERDGVALEHVELKKLEVSGVL